MVPVSYATHFQAKPRSTSRKIVRLGGLSLRVVGFIILALLALLYIAQSSRATTARVENQSQATEIDQLRYEQQQLQLDAERIKSLDTMNQFAPQSGLEPVTEVEHLK